MITKCKWLISILIVCLFTQLSAQSIEEKKANLKETDSDLDEETEEFLIKINHETLEINASIRLMYAEALNLYINHAPPQRYQDLLQQINLKRQRLNTLQNQWRELVAHQQNQDDLYGLWHAPDTTLEQLIVDYGSQDYVYLIPSEVGGIRLSINSNLPIPRAAWGEMLEMILNQNGVGAHELNPYLRELYLLKENHANLKAITNNRRDLEVLSPTTRIAFVISPELSEIRRTATFLEKFINPQTTSLQVIGRDVLVIGSVGEVNDLLKLFDFIASSRGEKDYRLMPVFKLGAEEMAKILDTIFDKIAPAEGTSGETNGLKVITLQNMAQALFIVGNKEEVAKAEEIIRNVENSIGGARERIVFWYSVKHSDAEELADVLFRVYSLMINTGAGFNTPPPGFIPNGPPDVLNVDPNLPPNAPGIPPLPIVPNPLGGPPIALPPPLQKEPPSSLYGQEGFYQEGGYVVNPAPAQPRMFLPSETNVNRDNFIVDIKTGSIVMVVESDALPKIKDLLRKLDVPKRMVQIETLLFEKILNRENSFGLNLLRIGDLASNVHKTGAVFNNIFPVGFDALVPSNSGVTEFFLSRKKTSSGIPALDLVYRFLLNQDDVQINSNPSIMTMNQTPATISINEDISINTGIFEVETAKGVTLKDAFTRAQYGITISIKPIIHVSGCEEGDQDYDYVTLETDVTFDTIVPGGDPSRPNVVRRHISNEVAVPDGDTVVLGGLRRKVCNDSRESVPFIGELPGIGKLFSINTLRDSSTEMFIFITPHIIKDPKEQLTCLRQELLCIRPGDIPYFLECVEEASRYERTRLMQGSMAILFGREPERYFLSDCCPDECGEYDGR